MKGRDSKRDDYIVFAHNSQRQNSDQLPKITVENEEYVVAIIPLTHKAAFLILPSRKRKFLSEIQWKNGVE